MLPADDGWRDDGTLLATLLGNDRKAIVPAVVNSMRGGAISISATAIQTWSSVSTKRPARRVVVGDDGVVGMR